MSNTFDEVYDFFRSLLTKKNQQTPHRNQRGHFVSPTSSGLRNVNGVMRSSGQKLTNPFNEIQVLQGHRDIIRILRRVDESRFISGGDDGRIVLWDLTTGDELCTMEGHAGAVTCFILVYEDFDKKGIERERKEEEEKADEVRSEEGRSRGEGGGVTLISASVDKSIRIWDLQTGQCKKHIKHSHHGGIKCLVPLEDGMFCSGGNDNYLYLWTYDGESKGRIEREDKDEIIYCMLPITHHRLIVGSNSSILMAYSSKTLSLVHKFAIHRESIRCLANIDDNTFASGSLDGVIVVWTKERLSPTRTLYHPDQYQFNSIECRCYIESVNHLLVLGKQYLAVCIDKGFKIFDTVSCECVMDCPKAHNSTVYTIISVYGGTRLVTASADGQIKLWGTASNFSFTAEYFLGSGRKSRMYFSPVLLGEMNAHSDEVKVLLKVSENSFLSAGNDQNIILWRDGNLESFIRNFEAAEYASNGRATPKQSLLRDLVDFHPPPVPYILPTSGTPLSPSSPTPYSMPSSEVTPDTHRLRKIRFPDLEYTEKASSSATPLIEVVAEESPFNSPKWNESLEKDSKKQLSSSSSSLQIYPTEPKNIWNPNLTYSSSNRPERSSRLQRAGTVPNFPLLENLIEPSNGPLMLDRGPIDGGTPSESRNIWNPNDSIHFDV